MNLFKVVRTVFQIHSKSLLGSKLCFGHHRQIRWESTEVPAAKESANEVSEKVTPTKQSNLMEFFDTGDKLYEHRVVHGRWWHLDDLRIKSNEDLHKLWYVLLKERNRLLTMEEEYRYQHELFPSPERIDKVEESMRNIMSVVRERDIAYNLLETGTTGELTPEIRETSFGLTRFYQPKVRILPFFKNRYYQLLWGKRKPSTSLNIFKRRYNESQELQRHMETNRIRKLVAKTIKKYPHLKDDEEHVLEEYKKRHDFEHFPVPREMEKFPKVLRHQTVWDEDAYVEKGTLQDPNHDEYRRLQHELANKRRRKKKN